MAIPHRRLLQSPVVSPPGDDFYHTTSSSTTDGDDESTFDANMVIILAVLLCCLIFVLGLNILARYGMRCILRSSNNISSLPEPGLKKQALQHLPEAVFGSGGPEMVECSICLGEFVDGERVRVLPKCGHGFHVGCIDTWLKSNASCPNCRISVRDSPPKPLCFIELM